MRIAAIATATGCSAAPALAFSVSPNVGCALAVFPADTRIANLINAELLGIYKSGRAVIAVRRQNYSLLVDVPGSSSRRLRLVREWLFEDGCGAVYQFSQSAAGLGSRLTITAPDGAVSIWKRDLISEK